MAATTLLTSDQFLAMPMQYNQWGNRIRDELIAGEIVVKPMPDIRHSIVQGEIGTRLICIPRRKSALAVSVPIWTGNSGRRTGCLCPGRMHN
jgi:Uma2 family endonuclease